MSLMSLMSLISLPLRNAYFLTRGLIKLPKLIKLIKLPKLIKLKTQNINPTYETHWGQGKFTFALPPM